MADYYPVLSRAIAGLESNAPEQRRAVYERARKALVVQLRGYSPPLSESEITRERLALEDAVRRLEADARAPSRAPEPTRAVAPPADEPIAPPSADDEPAAPAVSASQPDDGEAPAGPVHSGPPVFGPSLSPVGPAWSPGNAEAGPRHSRWPAIAAAVVVLVIAAIGGGAYLARDQLSHLLTPAAVPVGGDHSATTAGPPPKSAERIGGGTASAPGTAVPPANPSPATSPKPGTTVARATPPADTTAPAPGRDTAVSGTPATQRAILYEETPDRQSGSAYPGTAVWKVMQAPTGVGNGHQTELQVQVTVPNRHVELKMALKRNLDPTLPASHTIDLQFKLPADFPNGAIANVPGILFKPTEQAAGTALAGLSVRVMNNFFLIGLSSTAAEQAHNLDVMRQNGWIDLPILYENGRRAVLTIQKGDAGTKAFDEAITAWQREAATAKDNTAAPASPPATNGTTTAPDQSPDSGDATPSPQ
jgi:hypothetical protein